MDTFPFPGSARATVVAPAPGNDRLGKRAWWMSKRLSAYVPDLDIDGANVEFRGGRTSREIEPAPDNL
jgi:hypothetical protein